MFMFIYMMGGGDRSCELFFEIRLGEGWGLGVAVGSCNPYFTMS